MKNDRGIALLIVLWVVVILALMAETFLADARLDTQVARNLIDNGEARALADSAVIREVERLVRQRQSENASFDGAPHTVRLEGGTVDVSVQDEAGKVNLNTATDTLLEAVLRSAGLEIDAARALVDRIADWRDSDHLRRLNGAEDGDYRAANLPYGAKDQPFLRVDELQLVLGITPEIYDRVAPALTVYADKRGVDLRAAPAPVLRALMDNNEARVSVFLDARHQQDAAALNNALQTFGISRRFVSSSSRAVFTISAKAQTANGARFHREAVVRIVGSGSKPYTILAWRVGER